MAMVLLVLLASGSAVCATPRDADEVVRRMEKAEAELKDVRLDFAQRTRLKVTADSQVILGDLAISKNPDAFRVNYTSPVEQVVVYDGVTLTLYLPEAGQAFRQKATLKDLSRIVGVNPVAPAYDLMKARTPALSGCNDRTCTLVFVPKEVGGSGAESSLWRLRLDKSTWLVEEAIMESDEVEVRVTCSKYRVNEGITRQTYVLELPEGTEVHEGIPQLMGSGLRGGVGQ